MEWKNIGYNLPKSTIIRMIIMIKNYIITNIHKSSDFGLLTGKKALLFYLNMQIISIRK
jgi:hypothetical protein